MKNTLEFRGITKDFPGVRALNLVSFNLKGGEVVAFLGENGAGKSTLLKILNGDYYQTVGQYLIDGKETFFKNPNEAIKNGVAVIYQERQILLELSIAENIFVGNLPKNRFGFVDYEKLYKDTDALLKEFELDISPKELVKKLNVAHQQMIEIIKAYYKNSKIIAFDEPTASLSNAETDILFNVVRKLKAQNKIVIYVTHRMDEIKLLADKIVVFKDGEVTGVFKKGEATEKELIKKMVGRDLGDVFQTSKKGNRTKEIVLELKDVNTDKVKNISFELRKGEILGFSGLVGSGRTEVMNAIFGVDKIVSGKILIEGKEVEINSPTKAIQVGIGLCPEDRKHDGIFPVLSVEQNMSIIILKELINKFGFIDKNKEKNFSIENIGALSIKTSSKDKKIIDLSGGNQQKIILARWLASKPKILILDEPTKGIDVGAKSEFYNLIFECAKHNMGIIVISSELPEVIGISDRIIVMRNGEIVGETESLEATEEKLLKLAMVTE